MSKKEIFFEIHKKVNSANFFMFLRKIPEQIIKRLAVGVPKISRNYWIYEKSMTSFGLIPFFWTVGQRYGMATVLPNFSKAFERLSKYQIEKFELKSCKGR